MHTTYILCGAIKVQSVHSQLVAYSVVNYWPTLDLLCNKSSYTFEQCSVDCNVRRTCAARVTMSVCLSVCLSFCLPVCLSVPKLTYRMFIHPTNGHSLPSGRQTCECCRILSEMLRCGDSTLLCRTAICTGAIYHAPALYFWSCADRLVRAEGTLHSCGGYILVV